MVWGEGAPRCTATSNTTGEQCPNVAMVGLTKCYQHGGSHPSALVKNAVAKEERALRVRVENHIHRLGIEPVTDPMKAYAEAVGEQITLKEFARKRLEHLTGGLDYSNDIGNRELNPLILLYERQVKACTDSLAQMVKIGFQAKWDAREDAKATAAAALTLESMRALIELARSRPELSADQVILEAIGEGQ